MNPIGLNLVVLRSSQPKELAVWYGKLLNRTVNEEKHSHGPLHHSLQLGDSVIEFYPQKHKAQSAPMTFGLVVSTHTFERLSATTTSKILNENSVIINDLDNNQIIVQRRISSKDS